jgi:hypothetical protein
MALIENLINIKHQLEKEDENILCGACVEDYGEDNLWICCDFSEKKLLLIELATNQKTIFAIYNNTHHTLHNIFSSSFSSLCLALINFYLDGMQEKDWISLVVVCSVIRGCY